MTTLNQFGNEGNIRVLSDMLPREQLLYFPANQQIVFSKPPSVLKNELAPNFCE